MEPRLPYNFNITQDQALDIQTRLAASVETEDRFDQIKSVAGVDVAYAKESDTLVAAVVVMDAETLRPIETVIEKTVSTFPYIPGLFSFRELPPLINAFAKIQQAPDMVVCDAHGYAHPRRFGLACHLGVLFDVPSIGCAKTCLIGSFHPPGTERGSRSEIHDGDETLGHVLRTQNGVKPVYVSTGHRVSQNTACELVLKLTPSFRLPETTRLADQAVRTALKELT